MENIFDKHEKMVAGLAKPGGEIIIGLNDQSMHNLHMAIGIIGEAAELVEALLSGNRKHVVEELGDCFFYITGLKINSGIKTCPVEYSDHYNYVSTGTIGVCMKVLLCSGFLLDSVKKQAIYCKQIDLEEACLQLSIIENCICKILKILGISHEECLVANYKKLGERYENHQYSDEQAQQRKDKTDES